MVNILSMVDEIDATDWNQVGPQRGTRPGGVYEDGHGDRWYVKTPTSPRQAKNEALASFIYRNLGFRAVEVHLTKDGRVASRWVSDIPRSTTPDELRHRDEALEVFLPSAWIANWDVVGLEYDNMLPDPDDADGVVLLDFGGSFDTRAMGGRKRYDPGEIPALDGFLDRGINPTAPNVFEDMKPRHWMASMDRLESVHQPSINSVIESLFSETEAAERKRVMWSRYDVLLGVGWEEVFENDR